MTEKEYDHDPGDDKDVTVLMWALSKKQWQTITKAIEDPASLFKSYEAWQAHEKLQRAKHLKKGYKMVKVKIDIPGTLKWCKENRKPINLASFSRYSLKTYARKKG